MLRVGPYTFSMGDARKTLLLFDDLWNGLVAGRDAHLLAPLRAQAQAAMSGMQPALASEAELRAVLPAVWAVLLAAGPALRSAGALPRRQEGRIAHLAVSNGGVPKTPVAAGEVGYRGLAGDRQAARVHHGRPFQALCVWSAEVIDEFRGEGHPLTAGSAGENVTVRGLPWSEVTPGVRLRLGTVLCEVSAYTTPCKKNGQWFLGGNYDLMHERHGPVSRVYATVLEPGRVAVDDLAVLEP